ncbi:hypothetical protein H4F45_20815, partial [Pectobacterium brasiliense]|nr:hypothetical protein [Pectobacterium brasiliense]
TLIINQELEKGDLYVRQLRARAPIINDPLLTNYINQIGNRLVKQAQTVRPPIHFYLISKNDINAFAYFAANVV